MISVLSLIAKYGSQVHCTRYPSCCAYFRQFQAPVSVFYVVLELGPFFPTSVLPSQWVYINWLIKQILISFSKRRRCDKGRGNDLTEVLTPSQLTVQ